MTLKTYTIEKKDESIKQVWEWEETPELLAAIEKLKPWPAAQTIN